VFVERIEVEEGFLDNLDISFKPGLNVIIGPRGSGKTSVIELIRFCLGATGVTKRSSEYALQQALAVLGSGQVTVTLNDEIFGQIVVTRTAEDDEPRCSYSFDKPLIFSQNEIESIGLQPKNRLNLIDGFTDSIASSEGKEQQLLAQIRSLTVEMRDSSQELDALAEQISQLEIAPEELKQLETEEATILKTVAATETDQKRLAELGGILAALSVRASVFTRTNTIIEKWLQRLDELVDSAPVFEEWPSAARAKSDLLSNLRKSITESFEKLEGSKASAEEALEELEKQIQNNKTTITKYDTEARGLRKQLEHLQSGAGDVARKVAQAREKVGQLSALQALKEGKVKQLHALQKKRKAHLAALDLSRNDRYSARVAIAKTLNSELNPGIEVKVQRSALSADYSNALSSLLRGSGLHYATLAPLLAQRMSPRELAEAVELDDAASISEHGEIPIIRANKLITHLKSQGLENILTCTIEDGVDFRLMDGTDYKSSEHASMGQRCTIVLPILLRRYTQPLILDQPEDHLDNAFVVGTLIRAIQQRKENAQLILATHNANIPILGEADLVVLMGSDGESGFVEHAGELDDVASVEAITSVMEGGIEAFNRRALFYSGEAEI
jgi:chromosome segregation ATPase